MEQLTTEQLRANAQAALAASATPTAAPKHWLERLAAWCIRAGQRALLRAYLARQRSLQDQIRALPKEYEARVNQAWDAERYAKQLAEEQKTEKLQWLATHMEVIQAQNKHDLLETERNIATLKKRMEQGKW